MTIERAKVGEIEIAYERLGDPKAPPLLLIMGMGAQLIAWPDGFCDELIRHGLQLVRFDNRDAGESTHMTGVPNFMAAMAGDGSSATYTLSDMAADSVGLLEVLGIASAHVVGASMGGFIGQMIAIEHPKRVRSLTSIMSTTGDRSVGQPHPATMQLFASGPPTDRASFIAKLVEASRVLGSPAFPPDPAVATERAVRSFERAREPFGAAVIRQAVAVLASGDRTERLHGVKVPTLVIHGAADPLVDVSGGRATAAAIPGAELLVIDGMGHDLPRALWPQIASKIAALVQRADAAPR